MIDQSTRPHDWPELKVVVHHINSAKADPCEGLLGGCAIPNFCMRRCDIYLQFDFAFIEEHERWHCKGYDHVGEHQGMGWPVMAVNWENYKLLDGPLMCHMQLGKTNYCRLWPEDKVRC